MKSFNNAATKVDLIATAPILLDGTALTVDSVTVANNMFIHAQKNVDAAERAVYDTGADHTQPWTKVEGSQFSLMSPEVVVTLFANQGTTYGNKLAYMHDVSTGVLTLNESGEPPMGTIDSLYEQTSEGLYKEVELAPIATLAANSNTGVVTYTFDATVPFTNLAKLRVKSVTTKDDAGALLVASISGITLTKADVIIYNIGVTEATNVSCRIGILESVL
jgi:hypothetical protein